MNSLICQIRKTKLALVGLAPVVNGILVCIILILAFLDVVRATDITVDKDNQLEINKIKSAYLYNFLKYIELSPNKEKAKPDYYSVCLLGKDPFGKTIDSLAKRTAKGLPVKVTRIKEVDSASLCHILYISQSEIESVKSILSSLNGRSILTVSDMPKFASKGGIIGFINIDKKIGIEINLNSVRKADIRISALLLEIAKLIE